MSNPKIQVCLMTAPSFEKAEEIARQLLQEGLVACVNLVPKVVSLYHWKGELCRDEEVLMVAKTSRGEALLERLPQIHPYEVPELLLLPVEAGLPAYLHWVAGLAPGQSG
jgi:periplasmic divalent cation tolerance protein